MRFVPFAMERDLSRWEHSVRWNISESGVHPMTLAELLEGEDPDALGATLLGYPQTNGTEELRSEIAALYPGASPERVLVTTGAAEANFVATASALEPGDEVVAMHPNYMQVAGVAESLGARVRPFPLIEEDGWRPDLDALDDAVGPKTRLIAVCNPNNPTGAVLTEPEMDRIAEVAERSGAWLLADEVYRGAELEGDAESPSFWGRTERLFVNSGLSKAFGLPGLRIGWTVTSEERADLLWGTRDYTTLSVSAVSDRLAVTALRKRDAIIARTRGIVRRQLPLVADWVRAHRDHPVRLSWTPPVAGSITAVRYHHDAPSDRFCERARVERDLLVVPATHFGMDGFLRIGYGAEPHVLETSLSLLSELFAEVAAEVPAAAA